jgi:hypothetical protein
LRPIFFLLPYYLSFFSNVKCFKLLNNKSSATRSRTMAKQPRKSFVGDHDISGIPVHLTFDENNVLVNPLGEQIPLGMIPTGTIFADEPARNAYSYGLEDVGKCYKQLDNNTLWLLINHSPLTWQALGDANQIAVLAYIDAAAREAAISGLADTDINKIALQASDNSLWQLIKSGATLTWQRVGDGAHAASVPWSGVEDKPLAFTPEIHPLNAHTVTELTPGHFLKATGTNSFAFTAHGLTSSDVGAAPNDHSHGNISYLGTLAAPSGTPIVIGAGGAIEAGRFGNDTGEYCEGNDPRLVPNTNLTPGQFLKATSPNTFAFGDHSLTASSIANDSGTPGANVKEVLDALASTVNGGTTYTDTDARAACIAQTITDGVTDSAPSQDAVFNAINNIGAAQVNEGVFDLARIPAAALERLAQVPDEAARFALTTHTVQLGDTVKQLDSGAIFIIVDENNLNNALGYVEYTAATAASVPWSGVTSKPTTLSGYGILDATPSSHIGATGIAHGIATESHNGFMSTSDKTKLEGIEAGAQVNVATNIALGTITDAEVPLTSSTGTGAALAGATQLLAGIMTATDKIKLDGIEAGAQVNVATNIALGTVTDTEVPLTSSTGTGTTLAAATQLLAGIMTAADKTKLDGISVSGEPGYAATEAGTTGSASTYARGDHSHPSRISLTPPTTPVNGDIWLVG